MQNMIVQDVKNFLCAPLYSSGQLTLATCSLIPISVLADMLLVVVGAIPEYNEINCSCLCYVQTYACAGFDAVTAGITQSRVGAQQGCMLTVATAISAMQRMCGATGLLPLMLRRR